MKTLLDEFHTSFLHNLAYVDGELRIIVAEGMRTSGPEDIQLLGHTFKNTYALGTSENSRLVEVRFNQPVAYQMVDESFTSADDYEQREGETELQVITRSRYLDYICANHGWFEHTRGPVRHYRIWTEDEVVDVVACEPPTVDLIKDDG